MWYTCYLLQVKDHQARVIYRVRIFPKHECGTFYRIMENIPGNLLGFLMGTNFAPIASAMGGPNIKPLASTPTSCHQCSCQAQLIGFSVDYKAVVEKGKSM